VFFSRPTASKSVVSFPLRSGPFPLWFFTDGMGRMYKCSPRLSLSSLERGGGRTEWLGSGDGHYMTYSTVSVWLSLTYICPNSFVRSSETSERDSRRTMPAQRSGSATTPHPPPPNQKKKKKKSLVVDRKRHCASVFVPMAEAPPFTERNH